MSGWMQLFEGVRKHPSHDGVARAVRKASRGSSSKVTPIQLGGWKSSIETLGKWKRAVSWRMQAPQSASGWRCDGDDQVISDVIGGADKHQHLESSRELTHLVD